MDEEFISFLIVGKAGNGKSATANSIIGQRKFESKANTTSTTKKCQREVARVQGHNVVVVDCPGLADTDIETDGGLKQLEDEIINIFAIHPDGFDVILITLRIDARLTEEERRVIQELDILFEEHFVKHCGIFIVTHADSYKSEENDNVPIEQSDACQSPVFTELLEKCNNRVVYFNNKTKDQSLSQAQVKRLLDLAVETKQNAPDVPPEIFRRAQEARDEAFKMAGQPFMNIKTETSLLLIVQDLESVPPDCGDIELLKVIRARILQQHRQLFDQNKTTGKLENAISIVFRLEDAVRMRIATIEENRDMTEVVELTSKAVNELRKLLQQYADMKFCLMNANLLSALGPIISKVISAVKFGYRAYKNARQECRTQ